MILSIDQPMLLFILPTKTPLSACDISEHTTYFESSKRTTELLTDKTDLIIHRIIDLQQPILNGFFLN